jgi:CRISPR-associated protein Csx16
VWAAEEGITVDETIEHLDPQKLQAGDIVIGSLPVNLAAEVCARGGRYLHLTLEVPPAWRGVELTTEDMRGFGARREEYGVKRMEKLTRSARVVECNGRCTGRAQAAMTSTPYLGTVSRSNLIRYRRSANAATPPAALLPQLAVSPPAPHPTVAFSPSPAASGVQETPQVSKAQLGGAARRRCRALRDLVSLGGLGPGRFSRQRHPGFHLDRRARGQQGPDHRPLPLHEEPDHHALPDEYAGALPLFPYGAVSAVGRLLLITSPSSWTGPGSKARVPRT